MNNGALEARLEEKACRTQRSGLVSQSCFLTPPEQELARRVAARYDVRVAFFGGYDGAERQLACFYDEEAREPELTWICATWDERYGACTHRDLLGSVMALGMDRERYGDFIVSGNRCDMVMLPEAAVTVLSGLSEAGRVPLHLTELEQAPEIAEPEGTHVRDTVASARLDAILSAAMNLSRTGAADLIRQRRVKVNHMETEKGDRVMKAGDIVSVRGYGRIRVDTIGEPTRKGRLPVEMTCFHQ